MMSSVIRAGLVFAWRSAAAHDLFKRRVEAKLPARVFERFCGNYVAGCQVL